MQTMTNSFRQIIFFLVSFCSDIWNVCKIYILRTGYKWDMEWEYHLNYLNNQYYNYLPIYAPNIGALQYVRQILTRMKEEINSNTIIVGDFNTPLTPMERWTKQKISKETQTLNDTMVQLDLIDIYRTFHPKTSNFTFFSSAQSFQCLSM